MKDGGERMKVYVGLWVLDTGGRETIGVFRSATEAWRGCRESRMGSEYLVEELELGARKGLFTPDSYVDEET